MFIQGDVIRDYVFPLALAEMQDDGYVFQKFLGTAFIIGRNGYVLTASHCVNNVDDSKLVGMFVDKGNSWCAFRLKIIAIHPEEDVALLKFLEGEWKSIFVLTKKFINSSFEYKSFGYPLDALYEELQSNDIYGRISPRPDLIFTSGYIRRRISFPVLSIRGKALIELSSVASEGCSGSPIFSVTPYQNWQVIGIYLGERTNDRATSISYAVRNDGFVNWVPDGINKSLSEESYL
jgi:hypothetical protein